MSSESDEMSIATAQRLLAEGQRLLQQAKEFPDPPTPLVVTGTDPMSLALAARTQTVEQPMIDEMAATKQNMLADAQAMIDSAQAVLSSANPDQA